MPGGGEGIALTLPIVDTGPLMPLLIPGLPLLAFLLCGLCAWAKVKSKLPAWITVVCLAISFVLTVSVFRSLTSGDMAQGTVAKAFDWVHINWGATAGKEFKADFALYLDSLTVLWMLFVTGLGALIALYASEYMSHDLGQGYNRFFAAFSLFVFSMACLVMGDNMLLLYLGWEGVGLCSYLLIGYFYKKPSAVEAAKKAFIVNRIGDLGLALGIMLTFVHFGSIEYSVIFAKAQPYIELLKEGKYSEIPAVVQLIPALLMIGAFGKSAQLPLYVWLPDAMEGPTPVSALIHAATMVTAGVYLIARTYPFFLCSTYALPMVAWVGALTALLAATIGMAQFDIKRIMAYSTVSQLGYMFAGLGVLTSVGAAFHVVTHAFFKALLFLCCGAVMHGFAGQLDLRKLSGVAKMKGWAIVGLGMFVGCINLAGFPLTAGFWSKDMILAEAFTTPGKAAIGWILLFTAGLTAYYTFRVFFRVFVGPPQFEPGDELHVAHEDHGQDAHGDHGHSGHDHHAPSPEALAHAREHFQPHAPGWAINTVLATLAVLSLASIGLNFIGDRHAGGWVGGMIANSSAAFESPMAHHGHAEEAGGDHSGHDHAHDDHNVFTPASLAAEQAAHGGELHAGTFLGQDPHAVMYYVSGVVGIVGIFIAWWLHLAGRTTAAVSKADALLPALGPIPRWAQNKWYVDELYNAIVRRPLLVLAHICHMFDKLLVDGLVNLAGWLPKGIGAAIRPSQSGQLHGYAVGMAGGVAVLVLIVLLVAR